jgi:hypothetical protein
LNQLLRLCRQACLLSKRGIIIVVHFKLRRPAATAMDEPEVSEAAEVVTSPQLASNVVPVLPNGHMVPSPVLTRVARRSNQYPFFPVNS